MKPVAIDWSRVDTREAREARAKAEAREQERKEALAYLAGTDWYVTRQAETGKAIPDHIMAAREAARQTASRRD